MKISNVVIGKRVSLGAAITSLAAVLVNFYPDHAQAIVSAAVPVTFAAQVFVAHKWGITQ